MLSKSTLLHLRLPFSYFLMPVYLFALASAGRAVAWKAALVFFIFHFLLYTASNAFNSYYDRDTGSIGALKNPPPVEKGLLFTSLALDAAAVALGFVIGWAFALMVFLYGMASKAYSWNRTRIKKRPVLSQVWVSFGQGGLAFLAISYGIQDIPLAGLMGPRPLATAAIATVFMASAYPMTQVYQHDEDRKRGDITLSLLLGVRGTFIFCAAALAVSAAAFALFFQHFYGAAYAAAFIAFLAPVAVYFFRWMVLAFRDPASADYTRAMRLNIFSSTALNLFFIIFFFADRHRFF